MIALASRPLVGVRSPAQHSGQLSAERYVWLTIGSVAMRSCRSPHLDRSGERQDPDPVRGVRLVCMHVPSSHTSRTCICSTVRANGHKSKRQKARCERFSQSMTPRTVDRLRKCRLRGSETTERPILLPTPAVCSAYQACAAESRYRWGRCGSGPDNPHRRSVSSSSRYRDIQASTVPIDAVSCCSFASRRAASTSLRLPSPRR